LTRGFESPRNRRQKLYRILYLLECLSTISKALDELKQLLLDFGSIAYGDVCSVQEFISIP
jgi:hypothetical protein